jgi:hypothetical protein
MMDALLFAVRDGVRTAGFGYGEAECDIRESGKPPPRCGMWYAAIHDGAVRSDRQNQLMEIYSFSVTLTARLVQVPIDKVGDQLIARNVPMSPTINRTGFNKKVEQLRAFLHMNWKLVVVPNQSPNSANDYLVQWCTGTVYGFYEPMKYTGVPSVRFAPDDWFGDEQGVESVGLLAELRFDDCKRFQPIDTPTRVLV